MADRNLQVRVGVNLGNSASQLKALNTNLKNTQSEFKNAGAGIKDFETTTAGFKAKVNMLNESIATQTSKMKILKTQIADTKSTMKEVNNAYEEQKSKVRSLEQELEKANLTYGENSKQAKEVQKSLDEARKSLESKEKAVISCDNKLVNLNTQLNNTEAELKNLNSQLNGAGWTNLGNQLQKTSTSLQSLGNGISSVGRTVSVASAGITGAFAGCVKVSMDFEKAMSQVQATSGGTAEEMELLSDNAERLGKEIKGASMTEVAESYNYLALAGYDVNEMLSAMEPTVKANIAFGGDMATTADLMTDSLSALGKGASEAEYYLNVVAQTSRNANTSGTELMEAYIECGATLSNLNVPLEESAKVLAVMADNGLKGSEAGRSLQSVLVNLMGTTSTTAGALETLGVNAYDNEGKFRGLETVLADVCASAEKMTDEQADMTLAMLGGKTQLTALNNMLKATDGSYDDLTEAIANSDGALEQMYQTMSDNTAGTWAEVQSKIEAVSKQFGDILLPIVDTAISKIGEFADWLGGLSKGTQKVIIGIGAFIVVLGPLLLLIGGLISSIGTISGALGALSLAIGQAGGMMAFFSASILPVITTLGTVVGVAGVVAMAIKENWEGIQNATAKLVEQCTPAFEVLKNAFSTLWGTCQDIYNTVIQPLFRIIGEVIEVCIAYVSPLLSGLMTTFGIVMNGISLAWYTVGKPIFSAIMAIIETLWAVVKPILQKFGELFGTVMSVVSSAYNNFAKPAFDALINIVKKVESVTAPAFNSFKEIITNAMNVVLTPIQWVIDKLKDLLGWISSAGEKVTGFLSKINPFKGKSVSLEADYGVQAINTPMLADTFGNIALSGQYYNRSASLDTGINQIIQATNGVAQAQNSFDRNRGFDADGLADTIAMAIQSALSNALNIQVDTIIDGRQVAKATAKYMDSEISLINKRKTRLGGAF